MDLGRYIGGNALPESNLLRLRGKRAPFAEYCAIHLNPFTVILVLKQDSVDKLKNLFSQMLFYYGKLIERGDGRISMELWLWHYRVASSYE